MCLHPACLQGVKETKEDRALDRARADVADAYDSFDMRMEMHWTDKKREDMTERDWRIFREDFSIAYKGAALGATALPLRNWEEGNLPKPLMKAIEKQACGSPPPQASPWALYSPQWQGVQSYEIMHVTGMLHCEQLLMGHASQLSCLCRKHDVIGC